MQYRNRALGIEPRSRSKIDFVLTEAFYPAIFAPILAIGRRTDRRGSRGETSLDWDYVALGLTTLDVLGRSIDVIPKPDDVQLIDEIAMTPAGTAAGPAIVAAGLGLRTRLLGSIGEDELGRALAAGLDARGVDTGAIQRQAALRTSATLLTIRSDGQRPAFHAPGASLLLESTPAMEATVVSTRCLHVGGIGTLPKLEGAPLVDLLARARASGAIITCDLIAPGPETARILEPHLAGIDWFMPTLAEAQAISGRERPLDVAKWFKDRGVGGCVFKRGGDGALLAEGDSVIEIPAVPVDVVDTTGCGDAFCAGFGAALVRQRSPHEAALFGAAVASRVATGLGSDAHVVPFEEIEPAGQP